MLSKSTGDDWFGAPDAARYLGLTLRTLYRLIDEGQVPAYKFGRVIRLRRHEIDAFIEQQRIQPGTLGHLYPTVSAEAGDDDDEAGDEAASTY
jgi:excisionase family DNA binding protein